MPGSLVAALLASLVAGAAGQGGRAKMRSISGDAERRVTIARSADDYISFPDVCLTPGGRLICAYRVADQHVATRSRTEIRTSDDLGKTWSEAAVLGTPGHCPRLAVMPEGEVLLITDSSPVGGAVYRSTDEGRSWSEPTPTGLRHAIPDRPLRLPGGSLLTTGHRHVGQATNPLLRQATSEQVLYRSDDAGKTWREWAPLALDPGLVLCEASMVSVTDGSLRALLRENSAVQEPTFVMESHDEGASWSAPEPAPTIGHRPCAGLLRSGKTLVTYRHVGPNGGNRAWLGDVDAERFYAPSAYDVGNGARLTQGGLAVENPEGDGDAVMYSLKPLTDPRYASARLVARVRIAEGDVNHCGVHLGCQWLIRPDAVIPVVEGAAPVAVDLTAPHELAFTYERGVVGLQIDGEARCALGLAEHGMALDRSRRPVRFGNVPKGDPGVGPFHFERNAGRSVWEAVALTIAEPHYGTHQWSWTPADGLPNQYEVDRILELHNDRNSPPGDFGYSGWVQLPDDRVFVVSHYRGDAPHSYVEGYWIGEDDFGRP